MSDGPLLSVSFLDFSLESMPDVLRELGKLFLLLWQKSPPLAAFFVIAPPLILVYFIYTWGSVRRSEKEADSNVRRSRESNRKPSKSANKGKRK
ncbi:hypothetical protein [Stutzerimonas xanthomarina]|uniref:hypothetical protein n=1 Tax=Stutzerimonas xanthomarina TaxID=271420 RepID=UPI003AA8DA7C